MVWWIHFQCVDKHIHMHTLYWLTGICTIASFDVSSFCFYIINSFRSLMSVKMEHTSIQCCYHICHCAAYVDGGGASFCILRRCFGFGMPRKLWLMKYNIFYFFVSAQISFILITWYEIQGIFLSVCMCVCVCF